MADTVYYVCKYTPLELLDGFGIPSERLDPAPVSFACADSCAHPNLCGYGKAVLEEVLNKGIDSLLLADCCDVCRRLSLPSDDDFYSGYADALLKQERPCMRMQFHREESDPDAAGVVYHTMKFCDYYGFAYRHRRENCEVPLLKIETDSTPQSSGQLHTRIDALNETIMADGRIPLRKKNAIRYAAGVDSGSASTDAVILDRERRIISSSILPTGSGAASGAKKALDLALEQAGLSLSDLDAIVTTGYGRETIGVSDTSVTEITCHARGAHFLNPKARTVIDIGGQDSKVIKIDETGAVINFVMNDKCAAGTGRFLDMMARTMELSLSDMSEMGLHWKNEVAISSMCTVFAESEVVSLIAQNTPTEDIIHGLNMAVAGKTVSLVHRLGGEPSYIMTGGVARNQGVVKALEEKLGKKVYVSKEAQLCGALGAALIALDHGQSSPGQNLF